MPETTFSTLQPYSSQNIGVFPFLSRSVMLWSAECEDPKLTNREIIFEVFQSM